ncbi:hypothetical protein MNBD_ALPHA11-1292 [hydrothermal vent metagenome]|uniref:3-beta hydroxysteroid dehydrogenase/isomerase domain-containing protein n=1 Tax=hydrothermal vent metagenome TaxID=652676 RepID=A0A3B0TCG8_9ZZZZ
MIFSMIRSDIKGANIMNLESKLVTVIGGSGFVGSQFIQKLAKLGCRIRVGIRRPDLAGHLLPLGTVGQILPIQVNVRNYDSVARAVNGADIVINLAGIWYERGKQKFDAVHNLGAANVARAAKEADVERLVHMSELGANIDSKSTNLVARQLGDDQVLKLFPKAIILRPSTIFGSGDRFFNLFGTWARMFPVFPVIGAKHKQQPVFVGDVAQALVLATSGKVRNGTIYELGGPDVETMKELMGRVLSTSNRSRLLIPMPTGLAKFEAVFLQILPNPWLTVDRVIRWNTDNIVSQDAIYEKRGFAAFDMELETMDAVLPTYMWRFCRRGQFEQVETASAKN